MADDSRRTSELSVEQLQHRVEHPIWQLVSTYCRPHLFYIGFGVFTMLIAQVFWLFPPVVLGVAFDAVLLESGAYQFPLIPDAWLPQTRGDRFWFSAGLIALSFICATIMYLVGSWARSIAAYRVQHDLRTDAYATVQQLHFAFFENQQTGELMSVLNNDVNQLEGFLTETLQRAGNATFITLGVCSFMILLNWQLALLAFLTPLVTLGVNYGYSRYIESKHQQRREEVSGINTRIQNNLAGMRLVKIYNRESYESDRVDEASAAYKDISWLISRTRILYGRVTALLPNVGYVLLFLVGGHWVLNGPPVIFTSDLTAGTLLTFIVYNGRLSWPLSQVTHIVDSYQETKAAGGRVLGLLNQPRAVSEEETVTNLDSVNGKVEYDDVSLTYEGESESALTDMSFNAEAGELIGIVGSTGSGKSTMVKLLMRFYDVSEGTIRLDNHDIRNVSRESLRKAIGYVEQDPYLFDGTVRENIGYSRPEADDHAVRDAAERASAHEFITQLPDGYATEVGERGVKLSGGQRQRISIARAVLSEPDILILDEATSHVDNETEAIIQSRLEELVNGRTTFVIAHRLSTIRDADQILVVDDGSVVERGTHDELLSQEGHYANLWRVQVGEADSVSTELVQQVTKR